MSRLARYKDSLNRFINERSCILMVEDENIRSIILNKISQIDFTLPIILLTIMNSQNKKNKLSTPGYYGATAMALLQVGLAVVQNNSKYDIDTYHTLLRTILLLTSKSLLQNLESIKNFISKPITDICLSVMEVYHSVTEPGLFEPCEFIYEDTMPNDEIIKWYFSDNDEFKEKFNQLKRITLESFNNYINAKYRPLCEFAMKIGWLLGAGDIKQLNNIKKISSYLSILYKLAIDFENIKSDVENERHNYIVNNGLQESYELFMHNKQGLIEECMNLDIYTSTVEQIITSIDNRVENVINETNPDLASNI